MFSRLDPYTSGTNHRTESTSSRVRVDILQHWEQGVVRSLPAALEGYFALHWTPRRPAGADFPEYALSFPPLSHSCGPRPLHRQEERQRLSHAGLVMLLQSTCVSKGRRVEWCGKP